MSVLFACTLYSIHLRLRQLPQDRVDGLVYTQCAVINDVPAHFGKLLFSEGLPKSSDRFSQYRCIKPFICALAITRQCHLNAGEQHNLV